MELVWDIPGEGMLERLEELRAFVENFPDSQLTPLCMEEIRRIEERLGW